MVAWTKETALSELQSLIKDIDNLASVERNSAPHFQWLAKTLAVLEEVFGMNSRYYLIFAAFPWGIDGRCVIDEMGRIPLGMAIERRHQQAYVEQLDSARGLLQAAVYHLDRSDIDSVYDGKDTGPESSDIMKIINLVDLKLRKTIRDCPDSEKDIQDAFDTMLTIKDIEHSRESVDQDSRLNYGMRVPHP